jgi:hypothetical protein
MPVKALADTAEKTYIRQGYKGIKYAIDAGADIIVCAWGQSHISADESAILQEAEKKGVVVVASVGNFPEEQEQYPAAHGSVLAVAAHNLKNKKINISNFGAFVDLCAPGKDILSAGVNSATNQVMRDGTSAAASVVAGAAALVRVQHPSYMAKRVRACLKSSAKTIDPVNSNFAAKLGAGKLDIQAAVKCSLFGDNTPKVTRHINPQGYLRSHGTRRRSAAWTIAPHGVFKGLRFELFSLEGNPGKGTLKFFSSDAKDAKLLASHPLSTFPEGVYIPGTTAHVIFEPTKRTRRLDWVLAYTAEPIKFSKMYCGDTVNLNEEGTLEDGSGAESYAQNSDCKWLITAPKGKVIHIEFTEFDTEARRDLLYFFNGAGTHEKIMAVFSGPAIPPKLTTWGNRVLVWFVTDGKTHGSGWKAKYSFRDP